MRQLFLKALAILALVAFVDVVVGIVSRQILLGLSDKRSQIATIQQALLRKQADVVILGASCAKYHYDPRIIADSLGMTVENTGVGGMNMVYTDLVLQAFLDRCTPRLVVVDIYGQLDSGEGRLPRLKPFYGISNPVTAYYDSISSWQQRLKLRSALYRYNGTLDLLLRHRLNAPNDSHGFAEMDALDGLMDTVEVHRFRPDESKLPHLEHVVSLCRNHRIQLAFVLSPRREHDISQEQWIAELCHKHGIILINELHVPDYYNAPGLFHDDSHLSAAGAHLFSQRVAAALSEQIRKR